ncbi:MAG: TonB-dependent receptor [Sphingomonas sp.]
MRLALLLATTAVLLLPAPAWAADGADASDQQGGKEIVVTGHLDKARASIQPSLGATTYTISNEAIQELPGGDNQQLNQVLLQLPGVTQDGFGQFHVRDDHNNLQYRINGTILPEGIAVFGQTLSPRLVDQFDLRTGALPAQYGLRTAGIIDITTKSGLKNGGRVDVYGGSHDTIEPSFEYGGSGNGTNYFVTGSYRHTNLGIEAVDAGRTALHDKSDQYQSFAYVDHLLGTGDRVSLIGGFSDQTFQIPNPRGLHPSNGYTIGGVSDYLSDNLNERQHEQTAFGIGSYLHDAGPLTLQASLFVRYSSLRYTPDVAGELLFNGIAQSALKRDFTFGGQVEGAYRLSLAHTIRAGVVISRDRSNSRTTAQVFPGTYDSAGNFAQSGQPIAIPDNYAATETTYSVYLQDEWKPFAPLTINFGGRFDRYEGFRSEQQFSPRVNAVLTPARGLTLHAGYARYFSPASFSNVAATSVQLFTNTSARAPGDDGVNPPLATVPFAERQDYFDIGLEQKLGSVTLGIDAYHRRSRNLADEGQFGAPIILTPFNYAHGRIDGIEGTINYQHGPLVAYANLAWAKAKGEGIVSGQFNFDPNDLAYIASHFIYLDHDQTWTASGGVSYRIGASSHVGGTVIYGSGLRRAGSVPNGDKLPPYAVVNLTASHEFKAAGIEVRVDINNVLDRVYEIRDGSGVGVGAPQFGARRGFFFGVSKAF